LAHLTTTILEIVLALDKIQTPRGDISKFVGFRPLTDKKSTSLIINRRKKDKEEQPQQKLRPEVQALLDGANWTREKFSQSYRSVTEIMHKDMTTHFRFNTIHAVRLLCMSGLDWESKSKNKARDWENVATAIVIETALVETYREKLLKQCRSARLLRKEIHDFFYSITPTWNQVGGQETFITDKKWIFPDNIYLPDDDDDDDDILEVPPPIDLRSQWKASGTKKLAPKKKKASKKVVSASQIGNSDSESEVDPVPEVPPIADKGTTSHASIAPKDNPPQRQNDDIQSLLAALKSIQNHKLLQCSDPDAPSGSTESIGSFALSLIGHVIPIASIPPYAPLIVPSPGSIYEQSPSRARCCNSSFQKGQE
jgi:hypothetical protein